MKLRLVAFALLATTSAVLLPTASQAFVGIEIGVQPPPPRYEAPPPPPPRPHVVWVPGYWQWDGGQHVWVPGRYIDERQGHRWIPEHWVQHGPNWRFVPGHWSR